MTAVLLRRLLSTWAFLALSVLVGPGAFAQGTDAIEAHTSDLPPALPDEYNGDVRDLPPVYVPRRYLMLNEFEPPPDHKPRGVTSQAPAGLNNIALAPMPAAAANFPGLGFSTAVTGGQAGGGWPPDTNGDVGPVYYIQSVNTAFGIFNKSTGALVASFTEDQLWNAASGATPCKGNNQGDPVVLHDALNDRWILTDFAFTFSGQTPSAPFYECLAVSKSGDPVSGGWWFYAVRMDPGGVGKPASGWLADYPKFGLWGDGCLYMATNEFDPTQPPASQYKGAAFASFNTANLYAGTTLTSSLGVLASSSDAFTMIPGNALGTSAASMPPSGTPEYFVNESNSAFAFMVRKFTKGTNCGSGGTLSTAVSVSQASYNYNGNDYVPQKNTTNVLDPLEDRIMQKVQYRKIGSAESLWVVHTTGDGSATPAQPQWAQINVTGGTIATTPVQQQIYAPDATMHRWMGSLAVDASGDMALGYSTSNSSSFPSIKYSGRLITDPSNNLSQTETQLVAGASSQNSCSNGGGAGCTTSRWGDYSSMSIDPSDDCTFWYTNEYYGTASNNGEWQTRIGAFKFPSCVTPPGPAAKLVFTQEPNSSYTSNAAITVKVSVEDAGGRVVTSDTSAITIALQGGSAGATLGGTKTVNAVAGVATFSVSVDLVGSGYTQHATDGSLTAANSTAFAITAGAATKLAFTTQPPASAVAGAQFSAVVEIEDAAGNRVTTNNTGVQLALTCSCATLGGNFVAASGGVATFNALNICTAGTGYQLHATDSGLAAATSNAFNIVTGAPASIAFTTQPATNSNIAVATPIPLAAHVQDSCANAIADDSVTLAIANNVSSATLSATTNPVATDSNGNVSFANVSLNHIGAAYTLKVTEAAAAKTATSNAFNIVPGPPAKLIFTTQPTAVTPGSTLNTIAVTEQDAGGNTITSDSSTSVDFTVAACGGTTDLGLATVNNGVATLSSSQVFNTEHAGYQVTATNATLSLGVASQAFVVGPSDLSFDDGFEACSL